MIAAQSAARRQLSDWLMELGWKSVHRLQSVWSLKISEGECVLKESQRSSQSAWEEWTLESPKLPSVHPGSIFAANGGLSGPWKFVSTGEGNLRCRGDVPRDVLGTDDFFDLATGKRSSPLESWAVITTALAQGSELTGDFPKPGTNQLVDWLKEHGFVASADGDFAKVTVPLSGTFREISIEWQDRGFVRLSTPIGRLEKWPASSLAAAEEFLQEANRRLRLVRIAKPGDQTVYSMEVCFCAPGPGVWLQSALEALCTGIALVVQPLAALRDPGVADMLLAGMKANSEGGVR